MMARASQETRNEPHVHRQKLLKTYRRVVAEPAALRGPSAIVQWAGRASFEALFAEHLAWFMMQLHIARVSNVSTR